MDAPQCILVHPVLAEMLSVIRQLPLITGDRPCCSCTRSSSVDGHYGRVGAAREAGHGRGREESCQAGQRATVGPGGGAVPSRRRRKAAATTTTAAAAATDCISASE